MIGKLLIVILLCFSSSALCQKPTHIGTFGNGTSVYGVVVVRNIVYVIREKSSQIERFNAVNGAFKPLAPLNVLKKDGYYDMVLHGSQKSVALLNWFDANQVIITSLSPPYGSTSFNFTDVLTSAALSFSSCPFREVVVTEGATKKIKMFTSKGAHTKTIQLNMTESPRQAIPLPFANFAVVSGYTSDENHLLCKFNSQGAVIKQCFGGKPGNATNQLNVPARVVATSDFRYFYLADMKNKRVMKLNYDLTNPQIILDESDGLNQPYRLYLHESANVLYVADNILDPVTQYSVAGRVMAFKL